MREALNLGYPGYNHCALNYDRHIGSQYGSGRVEKGMLTDSVKILLDRLTSTTGHSGQ
jgi:hypothetical protein